MLKPWDPPEQNLYPVLDDLLGDWQASYRPPFEGLQVLGTRWSRRSYELREFLARNQVHYQWLDAEEADRDPEVRRALDMLAPEERRFPVVLFQDGGRLPDPSHAEVAGRIGFNTRAGAASYDLIILGGGQAGLSARIENYLGFPSGINGSDLARRAVTQARRFGAEILAPHEAVALRIQEQNLWGRPLGRPPSLRGSPWTRSSLEESTPLTTATGGTPVHYPTLPCILAVNRAMLTIARSCVPSPHFSFSSQASTLKLTRRPSTPMTSALNVTVMPIGVAARW